MLAALCLPNGPPQERVPHLPLQAPWFAPTEVWTKAIPRSPTLARLAGAAGMAEMAGETGSWLGPSPTKQGGE